MRERVAFPDVLFFGEHDRDPVAFTDTEVVHLLVECDYTREFV
jgi:hypothetical protein